MARLSLLQFGDLSSNFGTFSSDVPSGSGSSNRSHPQFSKELVEHGSRGGRLDPPTVLEFRLPARERFQRLAGQWRSAVEFESSLTRMVTHPLYQQIIGMGASAVPFLLGELKREPDHWFWALTAITGEDPVPETSRGNLEQMAQAWLTWGRERGYTQAC